MMKKAIYKGFTLIELLVVISIIGMIVAFAMFGMQGAFEASRDTNRKSDLEQYEAALEIFANNNDGYYPRHPGGANLDDVCNSDFGLSNCPQDPEQVSYYYISDADGLNYAISADLEGDDDFDWMVCSGGIVGEAGQPSTDGSCTVGSVPQGGPETPGGGGDGICEVGGIGSGACSNNCVAQAGAVGGYCTLEGNCVCIDGTNIPSCNANECITSCVSIGFGSGVCRSFANPAYGSYCECSGGGSPTTVCTDSDAGSAAPQYTGGYVNDVNGVVTFDYCSGIGSLVEQGCQASGTAYETPYSCDAGTTCVSDPTGAYCPSGGSPGGSCDENCNTSCQTQGLPGGSCDAQGSCVCTSSGTPFNCTDTDPANDPTIPGYVNAPECFPTGIAYDECDASRTGTIEVSCDFNTRGCNQIPTACPQGYICTVAPGGISAYCQSSFGTAP